MTDNLFSSVKKPVPKQIVSGTLFADGGARGNPGPAAGGCVLYDSKKKVLEKDSVWCGIQTNNFAEYAGMICGLELAIKNEITDLQIFLDSKLIVEQMSGRWKIKNANIKPLAEKAKNLCENFHKIRFDHIPREKNKVADLLANQRMDRGQ
ncbi:ribonuclease HI family protein [bacterium]|jgi:ribonuclease HI|nr:ribonuclease HI family protein [bacterium]MBT6832185.1 ribonuclease HI family protein [bacterium]MBT6996130.1 ribonuclease HI family protein [bacterium]MBT7772210.1 ribonuclease HI family protein [bacterium]